MQIQAMEELENHLKSLTLCTIIMGGDFNITLNPLKEKMEGRINQTENKNSRNKLKEIIIKHNLEDIMRNTYPDMPLYTWHCKGKGISSWLDYLFISENYSNNVLQAGQRTALYTDHDIIYAKIKMKNTNARGRGYWKLNTSYLRDPKFAEEVKRILSDEKDKSHEFVDKCLHWDYTKMLIRSYAILFGKKRKNLKREENNSLLKN